MFSAAATRSWTRYSLFMNEHRQLFGGSLFNFKHEAWLPRRRALQTVYAKKQVAQFAGHMAEGGDTLSRGWVDGAELDLDQECRRLTVGVLARSVLGLDLDGRADPLGEPLRTGLAYVANRSLRPVRAPSWLPTPAGRRARAANACLHRLADDVLQACRADPTLDAPLVRTLMDIVHPDTGQLLSDEDIATNSSFLWRQDMTRRRPPWPTHCGRWAAIPSCRTGLPPRLPP